MGLGRAWRTTRTFRYAVILGLDAAIATSALLLALALRFEGRVPAEYLALLPAALALLAGLRLLTNAAARLHRWSFRLAGLSDGAWVVAAAAAGTVVFVTVQPALQGVRLPRTVYALEFFLSLTGFGALRFGPRLALHFLGLTRHAPTASRAVIAGAGDQAELLARDLLRATDSPFHLVGFVSEDPAVAACRLDGIPVLGSIRQLPRILARHRIQTVLMADASLSGARIREILSLCASRQVRFKLLPASFAAVDRRLTVAALADLAPDDLLPRDAVPFDEEEVARLVRGRRTMVTGAAGSIGSEIARQLARHGAAQIVMVDINENDLYLGARAIAEQYPGVEAHAEVADVREPGRLGRLAERFRPQDVFHAAAHKHVPLMEDAPEEAVKNNVFGTLHVARMADACGAERFVFISTDKAVNPSSVMGATKRAAELVVRALAQGSRTRMTCVRFGNVLGSAGSVVPLFKQQIARGGPVTVTDPECTRYFMTIPEAVGLVLLAGLGGHGELCVLDMGEPIRIMDLARNLITLAGRVPDAEIPIVFTGMRPGEKLREELLTEEEERSERVQSRIHVTESPPPPPDLFDRLERLRALADDGRCQDVLDEIRALVPTFRNGDGVHAPCAGGRAEPVERGRTAPRAAPARNQAMASR